MRIILITVIMIEVWPYPADIDFCLKSAMESPQQCVKYVQICSGVFIVNFEQISHCSDVSIVDFEQVRCEPHILQQSLPSLCVTKGWASILQAGKSWVRNYYYYFEILF